METIDLAPPSLGEGPTRDHAMRFIPYNGEGILPGWLMDPSRTGPRVAVTFGSLDRGVRTIDMPALLQALSEVEAESVSRDDLPAAVPSNVRTSAWVPLHLLLRSCIAAIHHGGQSSMTCAASGVPQLVLPAGGLDMRAEAELLERRGVALVVPDNRVSAEVIDELMTPPPCGTPPRKCGRRSARYPRPRLWHAA